MITFPRVRAAGYAIYKRMQGYHLLQNPVGTPTTEVNMIKENYIVTTPHLDDVFRISRIKKTFTNSGSTEEKRVLDSTHYMDTNSLQMTTPRKKNMAYEVYKDHDSRLHTKEDIPLAQAFKRKKVPSGEHARIMQEKNNAHFKRGYVEKHHSPLYKALALGLYKQLDGKPVEKRPNFFRVLYRNLTNKGYLKLRPKYLISE